MDLYEEFLRLERGNGKPKRKSKAGRLGWAVEHERQFGDFECGHCHLHVSAELVLSRVNNRNHCPYCLWSKHVDLREAGDRLGACKGKMQPVGLTLKRGHKKYAGQQAGELMIVHQCAACGALSINRSAADDYAGAVWDVFEASRQREAGLQAIAGPAGIAVLGAAEREVVRARMFGRGG